MYVLTSKLMHGCNYSFSGKLVSEITHMASRGNHKPPRGAKLHNKSQNFINFIKISCDELASYDDVTSNADDVIGAGASLSGGGELTPCRAYAKYL